MLAPRGGRSPARAALRLACALCLALACAGCDRAEVAITQGRNRGVKIQTTRAGDGPAAREGSQVRVHYKGYLPDGSLFMNTRDNGKPHVWNIGDGTVILGMDMGVRGMRVGERRTVSIPPELHWGNGGYGGVIPKNVWLTFEVEMVSVR